MAVFRTLGTSEIRVSTVAMGCWPISGMTSLNVTQDLSLATLAASRESGVNFFDTAYCYGADGESERLIGEALGSERDDIVIATKGGIHWNDDGERELDARPETLRQQCEDSLQRLNTDRVDLLYLHAPDPETPLVDSAGALLELMEEGKTRTVGASNLSLAQLQEFHEVCPLTAFQPPYNLLQRNIEAEILPWCRQQRVSVMIYWPLMKGMLAGKLTRNQQFPPGDGRAKYPMFQGEEWQRNMDFVDNLRQIATNAGITVAQLAVAWTLQTPGITAALCGAKRPGQIRETATAMDVKLSSSQLAQIEEALQSRGSASVRGAV